MRKPGLEILKSGLLGPDLTTKTDYSLDFKAGLFLTFVS